MKTHSRPSVAPLVWVLEPSGCWFGETITGAIIVCVYAPACGAPKVRLGWRIYQYWGANPDRCKHFGEISNPKTGKPQRYKNLAAAKAGAQRYWRREVLALLSPL